MMTNAGGNQGQGNLGEAKEGGMFGVGSNGGISVMPLMLSNSEQMPKTKETEAADGFSDEKADEQEDEEDLEDEEVVEAINDYDDEDDQQQDEMTNEDEMVSSSSSEGSKEDEEDDLADKDNAKDD